jgi:F-type H+-transporting ATPase subunit gamma
MANLRNIRQRISSVRSTSKITQAMKLVAAAKLRRAQSAITAARPYARGLADLVGHLLQKVDRTSLPLMMERDTVDNVLIVVVSSDRGLCGSFNTNAIKAATALIHETYQDKLDAGRLKLVCIGRRGATHFSTRGYPVAASHIGIVDRATFADVRAIMTGILNDYLVGTYDRVVVVYTEFTSMVAQHTRIEQLLPLPEPAAPAVAAASTGRYHDYTDYIYEPSEVELMELLIPKHLNFQLFRIFLESNTAEQAARMRAMEAATTNAKDLIRTLQLAYNSARQAAITKEILEIVGGAEALRQGS